MDRQIIMQKFQFLAAGLGDLSETPFLTYVDGYQYQARNNMIYFTGIYPKIDIISNLIVLRQDGWMWVSKFFAWDGASGPAIDTKSNIRGSHAHDACAALMRLGLIPMDCRFASNTLIRRLMIDDGASKVRATAYKATLDQTSFWCNPKNSKIIKVAP